MDGIVILDKPKGITSREAVEKVKHILKAKKAGNSGTLDPNATGVLVICLEKAVKIMPALQGMDKEYLATIHFHSEIERKELETLVKKFTGKLKQVPPVKSAVSRKEREREVYSIEIIKLEGKDAVLKIRCQAGTYIRKIADDMGREVGGAHLKDLQRTAVGNFVIGESHKIEELEGASGKDMEKMILPVEKGVENLEKIKIKDSAIPKAMAGKPISLNDLQIQAEKNEKGALVAVMSGSGKLIALAIKGEGKYFIDRVI